MTGPGRRFDPSELVGGADPLSDHELTGLLASARTLESYAQAEHGTPSAGLEDRVMAAIAGEAPPRPVAGGWSLGGFARTLRDSWRIAWSGDRPVNVRAQALAFVLVGAVAAGSVGGLATVGAVRLLTDDGPPPVEPVQPSPAPTDVAPSPATPPPPPSPTLTPSPSPSPTPSPSPSPSPTETAEPSETPDDGGSESGGQRRTAKPTGTDRADETDEPGETEHPDDTPDPDDTPRPTRTPDPDDTPQPTDDDSSGPGSGSGD